MPGIYYIQETKTIEGYELNNKMIKVTVDLNEKVKVDVTNNKEEPNIEVNKKENKVEVKLPKTGM